MEKWLNGWVEMGKLHGHIVKETETEDLDSVWQKALQSKNYSRLYKISR
jgi:hypothetical protein